MPEWTYQHGGKLAVIVTCSARRDLRAVSSTMMRHPVILHKCGNLPVKLKAPLTRAGRRTVFGPPMAGPVFLPPRPHAGGGH